MTLTGTPSRWARAADLIDPPETRWRRDPVAWATERAKLELWSKQREIFESVRDHPLTAVRSCHSAGKCEHVDSLIMLGDGTWRRVGDLIGTEFTVHAFDHTTGDVVRTTAHAVDNGEQDVWRVTTVSGRTVVRTGHHPLFVGVRPTRRDRGNRIHVVGWRGVSELRVDDLVLVPTHLPNVGDVAVSDDECSLLGYLLGDGSLTTNHVSFSQVDGPVKDHFVKVVRALGSEVRCARYGVRVVERHESRSPYGHNPVRDMVRLWGLLGTNSYTKFIPDWVWRLPDRQLALVMAGLFDTDGSVNAGSTRGSAGVAIGLVNERLIRDVQRIMTRLGVAGTVSRRVKKITRATGEVTPYPVWLWYASSHADTKRFLDVIPLRKNLDRIDRARANLVTRQARYVRTWHLANAPTGFRWDPIAEITYVGRAPTAAVSVPRYHTFIADLVEHNSYSAATLTCWWIDVHPAGQARVITTAPTSKQVDAVLWYEINKLHAALGLRGRTNKTEWYLGDRMLVALGRKPPDHVEAAFQGLHARHLLVILDEAYGIPKHLWDEASTLASNEFGRILAIGNPDGPGEFEENCKTGSGWNVIHVSYRDTPNFTGEPVSPQLREMLLARRWVDERRQKWGESSALFQSKCEGNFPSGGDPFAVIQHDWAVACRSLELPEETPVEAGIDVGGGGDRTVLRVRRGWVATFEETFVDADPMRSVGRLGVALREQGVTRVKVDSTGLGWAVAGRLRELSSRHNPRGETIHAAEVVPVNFGARPSPGNEKKFLNMRAELWWGVGRELSRMGTWDLGAADDDVIHELTAPRYKIMDSYGKIKIEPKEDVIKRLGLSPDRAEALILAFWETRRAARALGWATARRTNLRDTLSPSDKLTAAA